MADQSFGGSVFDTGIITNDDIVDGNVTFSFELTSTIVTVRDGALVFADPQTGIVVASFADFLMLGAAHPLQTVTFPSETVPVEMFAGLEEGVMVGTEGDDVLIGTSSDDYVEAGPGDDVIDLGQGYDYAAGGFGSDTYVWGADAGTLEIDEDNWGLTTDEIQVRGGQTDTLDMSDINSSDVTFIRGNLQSDGTLREDRGPDDITNDMPDFMLVVQNNITGEMAILYSAFGEADLDGEMSVFDAINITTYQSAIEQFIFADQTLTINEVAEMLGAPAPVQYGDAGDNILNASAATQVMSGGEGDDSYVIEMSDSNQIVIDDFGGHDTLIFGEGFNASDLNVTFDSGAMVLGFDGMDGFSVINVFHHLVQFDSTMADPFAGDGATGIDAIAFADGTVLDQTDFADMYLASFASDGDDNIRDIAGRSTLNMLGGDDYVYIDDSGNFTVDGGDGFDRFRVAGNQAEYVQETVNDVTTVTHIASGDIYTLTNIEEIEYGDAVVSMNAAPIAPDIYITFQEDTTFEISIADIMANVTDAEGDTVRFMRLTATEQYDDALVVGNTIVFTPEPDFAGSGNMYYHIRDAAGNDAIGTIHVTVTPINESPTAGTDYVTGALEDQVAIISADTLLANDGDPDGDVITIVSVEPVDFDGPVAFELDESGNIVATPAADFNGTVQFYYTIADPQGETATQIVTLRFDAVNDLPEIVSNLPVQQISNEEVARIDIAELTATGQDLESATLELQSVQDAVNGTVEIVGGEVVFIPAEGYSGPASFSYTLVDADGGVVTGSVDLAVEAANIAPVLISDIAFDFAEDGALVLTPNDLAILASDADGDALTITLESLDGVISVTEDAGVWTLSTPADFYGTSSIRVVVTDGEASSVADATVSVSAVNDAPVVEGEMFETTEDTALTLDVSELLANDSDVDGDTLVVESVTAVAGGTVELVDSQVVFTPGTDFNGEARFAYTVTDGNGAIVEATATVTVTPVNDAPVIETEATFAVSEDNQLFVDATDLLSGASDVDGDTLSVASVSDPQGGSFQIDAFGNLIFTPDGDFNGEASFSYVISDGQGGTVEAVAHVSVSAVNDAPVVEGEVFETTEDTALTLDVSELLANDSDVDGDTLVVESVTAVAGGTVELVDGQVVFTPETDFNGEARFAYTVTDGNGAIVEATATVTVTPVNDAPVVSGLIDLGVLEEEGVLTVSATTLLATASDLDEDMLSIRGLVASEGVDIVDNGDGTWTLTATMDFAGDVALSYTVTDGTVFADASAILNISAVNDAPVVEGEMFETIEDTALTLDVAELLANDSDVDGDTLVVESVTAVAGGTVELVDSQVVFTPETDFNGEARFAYTVTDGNGAIVEATATVTVTPVNDAPVVANDYVSTEEDLSITLSQDQLLENDSDVDSALLTIVAVTAIAGGSADLVDGQVVFTPEADFNGEASFTYTATDADGAFVEGIVFVNVAPINDTPIATDDGGFAVTAGDTVTLSLADLLANDSDIDGDDLVIADLIDVVGGTANFDLDGNIVFTVDAEATEASFSYVLSDGTTSSMANVSLAVSPADSSDDKDTAESDTDTSDPFDAFEHGTDEGDVFYAGHKGAEYFGADGDDVIKGSNKSDALAGGDGDDYIAGRNGNDEVWGGEGNDELSGGNGEDRLLGGAGNDHLEGGRGDDTLEGGLGDDILEGGKGDDTYIWAGEGNDIIRDERGDDTLDLSGVALSDLVATVDGKDMILTHLVTGETLTIENQFKKKEGIDSFILGNGESYDADDLLDLLAQNDEPEDTDPSEGGYWFDDLFGADGEFDFSALASVVEDWFPVFSFLSDCMQSKVLDHVADAIEDFVDTYDDGDGFIHDFFDDFFDWGGGHH